MPWVAGNQRHARHWQCHLKVIGWEEWSKKPPEHTKLEHCGLVNRADFNLAVPDGTSDGVFVYARSYPQFVVKALFHDDVPPGAIVLNQALRLNFEVTVGEETFPWSVYDIQDQELNKSLTDIVFEIRPFQMDEGEELEVDRETVRKAIGKALWRQVLTMHERILITVNDRSWALRVHDMAIDMDLQEEEDSITIPDVYRGIMETSTNVILDQDCSRYVDQFKLLGPVTKMEPKPMSNIIDIYCNDEEWFPVKKKLLQPCTTLAKSVLAEGRTEAHVDLDCCTFDKVLLYLEAEAKGERFEFDMLETDQLLEAANKLRLVGLKRLCEKMLGDYSSSIRAEGISFEEVKTRNASGEVILVIDNQVIDVTNWLDLHPGGNVIIPSQALNVDATVLFEVYHASRDSFLYLKQLYIGPLKPQDIGKVPPPNHQKHTEPSPEFLQQLRSFMDAPAFKVFKSF